MKPADLKPGDRLDTAIGALVVSRNPWCDFTDRYPEMDRVFVDVEVPEPGRGTARMLEATGAVDGDWLSLAPLRYRLAFRPDTDVEVNR